MVLPVGSHTAIENQKETVAMTTTHRAAATALLVLSLAAASAPIAGARPADFAPAGKRAPASVYDRPGRSMIPVSPPQSGFDCGDAGIGAVGGLALAMLGVGGGLVIAHQRPRRTRPTTTMPS